MADYRTQKPRLVSIVTYGRDVLFIPAAGWTPLMYASYVGHDTIVNLLLDMGVETSKGTPNGLTPLMVAAGCGNESVCYFLMQVLFKHRCSMS